MEIVNIKGVDIPIVFSLSKEKGYMVLAHFGLINIILNEDDSRTFEDIIKRHPYRIIKMYNHMRNRMVYRTEEEYDDLCAKYFNKYEKELEVEAKEIIHAPLKIYELGYADDNYTVILNCYMRFMPEDVLRLTIYHELCHLYTFKYLNTMEHDEDFYNIFHQEFPKHENDRIMNPKPI
ncbi:MAG: hypothetical protein BZ138_00010 [Methanosphaera sp. rholeuAM270]|nr:MAG: hypothetical protein BZ138_00010 [Methanosphaera sp. rholeuAM270]